jgi:hypothetical protein
MVKFIPETEATQPDLDLVEPGCAGSRKMEVHVWMALQPAAPDAGQRIEASGEVDGRTRRAAVRRKSTGSD